jgi:predicted transposase/invertase (TIGR01784 family)
LDNYSFFIDKIRENQKNGFTLEKLFKDAIEYCIKNNILKEYLEAHGSEAYNMIFTEWNWDTALEVAHEEGREDGLEKGREEGIEFTARNALSKGIPVQTVQEITGLSLEKISALTSNL